MSALMFFFSAKAKKIPFAAPIPTDNLCLNSNLGASLPVSVKTHFFFFYTDRQNVFRNLKEMETIAQNEFFFFFFSIFFLVSVTI